MAGAESGIRTPKVSTSEGVSRALGGRPLRLTRFAVLLLFCVAGATVAFLLLTGQGSSDSIFQGIPDERVHVPLRLADSDASPAISSNQAIATAIRDGAFFQPGTDQTVQETVLLIMKETRPVPHDRLVWGVHFADPVAALGGRYQFMGPDGNILHEAGFAIALVDAETGEFVATMQGWERLQTLPPGVTPPPPLPVSE